MAITRRELMAGLAAGAGVASAQDRTANGPKARLSPVVCAHSEQFPKIAYDELGQFLRTLGFDGCMIWFGPTGHVTPEHADLDLMRFVEAVTGNGLDVPALATTFTSPSNSTVRLAFAVGGEMGIPVFRPGEWKYGEGDMEQRIAAVQRDIMGFASLGSQTKMAIALHNGADDAFGASVWDIQMIVRGVDQRLLGYDFDIGYATAHGGRETAAASLRMVLPRLKAVTVRDCYWNKTPEGWKLTQCPLGEGMVDWPSFFTALARIRFTGPILLAVEYSQEGDVAPVRKDLAFVKKNLAAVYGPL
ncbi:MAG TPA: TIM barrel protein [Bryobacteraceae bacterium]|nr:TIM barrel protein [Bryobacteraceae bacterium]